MSSFLERLAAQVLNPGGVRPRLPSRYERAPATLTLIAADAEGAAADGQASQQGPEQPTPAGPVSWAAQRLTTAGTPGRDRHQDGPPDAQRRARDGAEPAMQPEEHVIERLTEDRAAEPLASPPPGASSSQQEDAQPARTDLFRETSQDETSQDKEASVHTGPAAAPAADFSEAALPGQDVLQPEPAVGAPGEMRTTHAPSMVPSRMSTGERGAPEEHLIEVVSPAGPAIPVPVLAPPAQMPAEAGEIPGQGESARAGQLPAAAVSVTRLTEDAMAMRLVTGRTAGRTAPVNVVVRPPEETLTPAREHISRHGSGAAPESGQERAAEPGIHVTIGSIEVRSPAPPPPPTVRDRPGPPLMTLDDYLARRREGDQR